jgi:hypothetical protein
MARSILPELCIKYASRILDRCISGMLHSIQKMYLEASL